MAKRGKSRAKRSRPEFREPEKAYLGRAEFTEALRRASRRVKPPAQPARGRPGT